MQTPSERQTPTSHNRAKGHHGKSKRSGPSSRGLLGGCASRRIMSQATHPYARHGFPHASPVLPVQSRRPPAFMFVFLYWILFSYAKVFFYIEFFSAMLLEFLSLHHLLCTSCHIACICFGNVLLSNKAVAKQ